MLVAVPWLSLLAVVEPGEVVPTLVPLSVPPLPSAALSSAKPGLMRAQAPRSTVTQTIMARFEARIITEHTHPDPSVSSPAPVPVSNIRGPEMLQLCSRARSRFARPATDLRRSLQNHLCFPIPFVDPESPWPAT